MHEIYNEIKINNNYMKGVHMAEKILILDDDEDIADILEIYLSNEGFDI